MSPASATPRLAFGILLKRHRRAARLTQAQVAERAGYSADYISMLERGARRPIRTTVALLADVLNISEEERRALEGAAGLQPQPISAPHAAPAGASPLQPTAGSSLTTLERHRHNLPIQPNLLLGREREIAGAGALLRRDDVRLVTLTGPGGIGKTRLALQVAVELINDFADGVYLVRLSRLADPVLALPTVAQTLGLKEVGGQPIAETMHAYMCDRQLLLVLDNFEQIVAAAPEVSGLLESAASLKILVTSRVPLRLHGEHGYAVSLLAVPDAQHAHSTRSHASQQSPSSSNALRKQNWTLPSRQTTR